MARLNPNHSNQIGHGNGTLVMLSEWHLFHLAPPPGGFCAGYEVRSRIGKCGIWRGRAVLADAVLRQL